MAKAFLEIPRGTPANAKANAARLAGLPQTPKHFPRDLRDSRKRQSISRETCGSTRKRQGKRRETCGTPANTKAFPVGLAPVVQAFPKTLCSLQPSIQAILQGLGASFFRSSSRCKDFWKGRSAVEGIRFAPIDRWEAIRACDLYPKCRSDPATHFRPQ